MESIKFKGFDIALQKLFVALEESQFESQFYNVRVGDWELEVDVMTRFQETKTYDKGRTFPTYVKKMVSMEVGHLAVYDMSYNGNDYELDPEQLELLIKELGANKV